MRSKWLWAALALVAVLGITTAASATTRGLITGKQIAPHTINSKHLVNHTIQAHDLSAGLIKSLHGAKEAKGNSGNTVRRINTWLPAGKTLTAPVISATGELGKLWLTCGSVTYISNPADVNERNDVIMYYSPNVIGTPRAVGLLPAPNYVTIPWSNPQAGNWLEMMIEGKVGGVMSLTTIHGYMQQIPARDNGCAVYFTMDTADVSAAPLTITPTG